jgi:hypothetical protein
VSTGTIEPTEIAGVKVASKDSHGPTTKLAIVAKAGTRYQPAPGLTVGLEEFAFKVCRASLSSPRQWTVELIIVLLPEHREALWIKNHPRI